MDHAYSISVSFGNYNSLGHLPTAADNSSAASKSYNTIQYNAITIQYKYNTITI